MLAQPIFTGGALTGQLQVAEAVQKQAVLNYQQVIQTAFAEVDNGLIAVAKLREQLKDADRHAVQAAVMPYEHLLPERFRGRNERIDERLP